MIKFLALSNTGEHNIAIKETVFGKVFPSTHTYSLSMIARWRRCIWRWSWSNLIAVQIFCWTPTAPHDRLSYSSRRRPDQRLYCTVPVTPTITRIALKITICLFLTCKEKFFNFLFCVISVNLKVCYLSTILRSS